MILFCVHFKIMPHHKAMKEAIECGFFSTTFCFVNPAKKLIFHFTLEKAHQLMLLCTSFGEKIFDYQPTKEHKLSQHEPL